jgi:hypothetical protein
MKLHNNMLIINGFLLLILGICGGIAAGSLGIGLAFCVIALLNLLFLIIFLILKDRLAVKTCLLIMGVSLLVGFSICSMSSFGMH